MALSHLPFLLLSLTSLSHGGEPQPIEAADPLLQDRAFVVVWNIPTALCHERYNVHLDLKDFDIVENQGQRFQGQKMTIFYRGHLGKYPYLSKDGDKMNGGLPQLGDLSAHLALAKMQMSSLLRPNFTGLAVIDWEEWRPLWEENFGSKMEYRRQSKKLVRQQRPDLPDSVVTSLARQNFEESARRFMEETMRLAVQGHPKGLWGFYGFPECFNAHKGETENGYTGRCHKGTSDHNNHLSWLWSQCTALYPSIYLPEQLAGSVDAALMVRHRVMEALRVASRWHHINNSNRATPVLPYTRLAFTHTLKFLNQTDLVHTLGESAALGAAGVVLWGQLRFARSKHQCILLRNYVHTVLGPFIGALRSDTQRCSLLHCHGNGRCSRRHPSSGHSIHLAVTLTSDLSDSSHPSDPSRHKSFHEHFVCQCYQGWMGPECQESIC